MIASKMRPGIGCLRCAIRNQRNKLPLSSASAASQERFISTADMQRFRKEGLLDEKGLTVFDTLHEMQLSSCQVYSQNDLFGTFSPKTEKFEWMTYEEYGKKVDQCRSMLKDLGVEQYDKVGIIANNRWEWATIAAAAYSLNASLVPLYEAQQPSDWRYILNDSECSLLFCANQKIYDKVRDEVLPCTPLVRTTLCLDAPQGEPHAFSTAMEACVGDQERKLITAPTPEDLANLIYTSGTTGNPKGVELTHLNFASNIKSASRSLVTDPRQLVRETDRTLAFLPWAHSYGQTCELWIGISMGSSTAVSRGISMLVDDLQIVKPTILFSVPTLYKKVYDGVHNMIESATPIRKRLMQNALAMGRINADSQQGLRGPLRPMEKVKFNVLDKLVLSKIRARFGGNLRYGCCAGAACPTEVLNFMDSIGIPINEGYGLSETSPIITINTLEHRSVGSVGRPIGGVTVYIIDEAGTPLPPGEEGEICCVGPNIMQGYHNNKKATDEVITLAPDGKSRM
jgi:long-chain acyl-CoA synthetase